MRPHDTRRFAALTLCCAAGLAGLSACGSDNNESAEPIVVDVGPLSRSDDGARADDGAAPSDSGLGPGIVPGPVDEEGGVTEPGDVGAPGARYGGDDEATAETTAAEAAASEVDLAPAETAAASDSSSAAAAPSRREAPDGDDRERRPEPGFAPPIEEPRAEPPLPDRGVTVPPSIQSRDAGVNPAVDTREDARSTFALDVDTGSYTLSRALVEQGNLPPFSAVRTEEFVNYFDQRYPSPARDQTFAVHVDGTAVPFLGADRRVVRVGIQGRRIDAADRAASRLTFVVDVSGSMEEDGKLELVKDSLRTLVRQLDDRDEISIVAFSDNAWVALGPTRAIERGRIDSAIATLIPTRSTNAEAGLRLGYEQAAAMYARGATNRVVLLSDGVANVGPDGPEAILAVIGEQARRGIDLATIGVGTTSFNDEMMERLADAGNGFYAYVDAPFEADRLFRERLVTTLQTIARDAKVQVSFDPDLVADWRLLGFENRTVADRDFRNDAVDAGELGAGHAVTALYEVRLTEAALGGSVAPKRPFGRVALRWQEPAGGSFREVNEPMRLEALTTTFDRAEPRLRLDVTVAAYAEVLRRGPWARVTDLGEIAIEARRLTEQFGDFTGDADVVEFVRLTERAASIEGYPTR